VRARVRLKARTEANVFICISSDAVTSQGSQYKTSLCWLCCATQCRVRRGLLPQVRTNEAEIEGWDFVSASPQGSLNPIESVVLRLTPPIWTLLSLRGTASTPGSSSLLVALRAAFSSFDKTADMRSDQAFDLIAAASGVLALVALAYLAFLLVGGMF
jgi:hypothetical protein